MKITEQEISEQAYKWEQEQKRRKKTRREEEEDRRERHFLAFLKTLKTNS